MKHMGTLQDSCKDFWVLLSCCASLGRTGSKTLASFYNFVREIGTPVRKWEPWYRYSLNSLLLSPRWPERKLFAASCRRLKNVK